MNQHLRLPAIGKKSLLLISLLACCFQFALAQPTMTKTGSTSTVTIGAFNTTTRKVQLVYLPGDLAGAASGNISSVFFEYASGTSPITFTDFIVRLGQPASGTFSPSTTFHSGLTEVFNEATYTIDPTGLTAGDWIEIPLEDIFVFDATLPLVVEVTSTAATGSTVTLRSSTGPSSPSHKKLYSTTSATATTGSTSTSWQNIGFTVTPISPNDAGIVAVTAPVTPATPGSSTPVTVSLRNYGSNTLTSVQINWSVDGITQTPFAWTGSLAQAATTTASIGSFTFTSGSHTIVAWTTLPNGSADGNATNDQASSTILSCSPVSGTVQINSAFAATNIALGQFKTFNDLATTLSSCGISGNVTVNVVSGSGPYVEQVTFHTVPGASAAARITINGNGEVIEFVPTATDRHIVRLDAAQWFVINNLTFRMGASSPYCYALHLYNGSSNNTVQNSTFDFATNTGSSSAGSFYAGIVASNSTTSVLEEGDINNLVFDNNTFNGGTTMGYGITLLGLSAGNLSPNNQITNNTITNYKSRAIAAYYTANSLIKGNVMSTNQAASGALYIWFTHSNITIDGNFISHHGNSAFEGMWLNTLTNSSTVKNNLIYDVSNGDNVAYGIRLQAVSTGTRIYHNTIILDDQTSAAGNTYAIYEGSSASTGYDFKNNIYYVTRTGTGVKAAYALASSTNITTGLTSNYNVFWVPGGNVAVRSTTTYPTLALWTAASGQDANSVEANPTFQPGTGIPTNLSINNIALPGTGVTLDIVSTTRSSTPDPGAYEFPGSAAPLPVHFSYFTGVRASGGNKLTWGTANEINNKGFELQRSIDGKEYETLIFVPSIAPGGNSTDPLHYQFVDASPLPGTNYYRLRQVDLDGRYKYSDIVVIKGERVNDLQVALIYPNPVRSELGLIISAPGVESVNLVVTDLGGRMVQQTRVQVAAGDNRITVDTQKLASGTYVLTMNGSRGERSVHKFVKQ